MTYSTAALRGALLQAVGERGKDYIYPEEEKSAPDNDREKVCMYSRRDGTPSCIVGYVINVIAPAEFERIAAAEAAENWSHGTGVESLDIYGDFTREGQSILANAQSLQDSGVAWGEAVREALKPGLVE